jgi:hypothetical protein
MGRVQEEIFWIVVLLLVVFIGVIAYVVITTPDSPADNLHPLIKSLELDVCSTYKVNYYGEKILTNCPGL